jgi:predicted nuclease of predicted toxin-antitoxin system
MNLSPLWVHFFEKHGISAEHWVNIGRAYDTYKVIFDYARKNDFVGFTNDLDFGAILAATNADFPSVFQLRSQELLHNVVGNSVIACLEQNTLYLEKGSLITFDTMKTRFRILPLNKNS